MKLQRTRNTQRNIISGFINKSITLLLPFLVRTLLIRRLGIEFLGLNSLFSSVLQVLNLADLGFSNAVVYSLYVPIAGDDIKTIRAIMNYFKKVYRIIGFVILFCGICLLPFIPKLIHGTPPAGYNIYVMYSIYLINTILTYLMFSYKQALLNAFQRTDIISNISSLSQVFLHLSRLLILLVFPNYYLFLIFMPISTVLNNLISNSIVNKKYKEYLLKEKIDEASRKLIRKQVYGLMVNKICITSRNSFDSIFISAFIGLSSTAIYNNYYYIISALNGFIGVVYTSMLSGAGNSIVTESTDKNYNDLRNMNFIYMTIAGIVTACLANLYQPFMKMWVGDQLLFNNFTVMLFCAYFYALKMGDLRCMYSDAAGLWWENRLRAIIEAVTNVVLNYMLGKYLGVNGIIIATLISILLVNFGFGSQIVFTYYFHNNKLNEYFMDHFIYFTFSVILCFMTYYPSSIIANINNHYLSFLLIGIMCVTFSLVLILLFYSWTKRFKNAMNWIRPKLSIKK